MEFEQKAPIGVYTRPSTKLGEVEEARIKSRIQELEPQLARIEEFEKIAYELNRTYIKAAGVTPGKIIGSEAIGKLSESLAIGSEGTRLPSRAQQKSRGSRYQKRKIVVFCRK
jgi:hypothetical protein